MSLIKVAITHGDVNGVGYEVLLKALSDSRILDLFNPIIYGSAKSATYHKKVFNNKTVNFNFIDDADAAREGRINLVNCVKKEVNITLGNSSKESGKSAFIALESAVEDLIKNKTDLLVTLPINKADIQNEEFTFPGHTEFLASKFSDHSSSALMIMASDVLRIALVTTHLPISEVSKSISKELILEKLKILNRSLERDFNIDKPRIAVLGLNPHAGEEGLLGNEEKEIITPAIEDAQKLGILCSGPFASDGYFGSSRYKNFDATLAMYHDQGLIPFKTLAMDRGVNFTAGLPIVRTSPDHGTGYDIAGKGIASEQSLREAIYLGIDIFHNRKAYDEARKNPIQSHQT